MIGVGVFFALSESCTDCDEATLGTTWGVRGVKEKVRVLQASDLWPGLARLSCPSLLSPGWWRADQDRLVATPADTTSRQ